MILKEYVTIMFGEILFKKSPKTIDKPTEVCYNKYNKERKRVHKMTRQEIEKRIEDLEDRRFALAMCDRWTQADYELDDRLTEEIRTLKAQLN